MAERQRPARMQVVEVDEPAPAARSRTRPRRGAPRAAAESVRGGRPRWWLVAGAVVAALALVVAWLVTAAQDRAYVRRVQAVPGMVSPLDGPPRELWRTPGIGLENAIESAAGRIVVVVQHGRTFTVAAHDATTGGVLWSHAVATALGGDAEGPDVRCPSDGRDVGPLVVCLVTPARSLYATATGRTNPPPTTVLAFAADDGRQVGRWQLHDAVVFSLRLGDDVVLATYDHQGHLQVVRAGARDGATRWSVRTPDALVSAQSTPPTTLLLDHGRLVVQGPSTLLLDPATGEVLVGSSPLQNVFLVPVGDGVATWRVATGWQVTDLDGRTRYPLAAVPASAAVDDGSTSRVVLTDSGDTLEGVDIASGTVLWSVPQTMNLVARVAHRFVVAIGNRYGVLDPRDGEVLWQVALGEAASWRPLTDGALVLGPGDTPDGGAQLVAHHLGDGVRAWALDLPEHVVDVGVLAGRVVVQTPRDVIVYG